MRYILHYKTETTLVYSIKGLDFVSRPIRVFLYPYHITHNSMQLCIAFPTLYNTATKLTSLCHNIFSLSLIVPTTSVSNCSRQ